jgi:hypothetical protein
MNEHPGKYSEQLERELSVQGMHKCASLAKGKFIRNDVWTSKSKQTPHEAIQKLSIDV